MLSLNRTIAPTSVISQLLIAQGAGMVMAWWIAAVSDAGPVSRMFVLIVAIQAVVAGTTARVLGMPIRWVVFNLSFAPAVLGALQLNVDPLFYGAAFLALLGVYGTGAAAHKVPLYLTGKRALARLEAWLPQENFSMLDLGAGTGRVLRFVAGRRGDASLHGVETAPLPFLLAWLRSLVGGFKVSYGDIWNCDLSQYDVVYAYLSPAPMERLWHKARREMRPGSLFISNSFAVPGVQPTSVARYGDARGALLHIWRM